MKSWYCATCQRKNTERNRFCGECGEARADTTAPGKPQGPAPLVMPWDRPGWKESRPEDRCDVEGCTKTVREHIDECLAITSRPGTLFTRPSQRDPEEFQRAERLEARRQELARQAEIIARL